jgi:hypothetical protein
MKTEIDTIQATFEDSISEEVLTKINTDDIKIKEVDGSFEIEVDDETETYKTLVGLGRTLKEGATEQEAFELAMTKILNQYVAE